MNTRQFLLFLVFLELSFSCFSQSDWLPGNNRPRRTIRFEAITAQQGLPHQTVNTIFQDHLGFIWMGTPLGLSKYDGYRFQTYQFQVRDTISGVLRPVNMNVSCIIEDTYGDLWVGCYYERSQVPVLFRFDRETEKLIPYLFENGESTLKTDILDLHLKSGFIWLRTPSLYRIKLPDVALGNEAGQKLVAVPLKKGKRGLQHERAANFYEDHNGRFWMPAQNGVQEWLPGSDTFLFHALPFFSEKDRPVEYFIYEIVEAADGGYWVFPNLRGTLMRYFPENGKIEIIKNDQYVGINQFLRTTTGHFWMGTRAGRGGIKIFDPQTSNITPVEFQVDGHMFFPLERIMSLYQDDSGIIWVGTEYGPLLKYEPQRDHFHWLHFKAENGNSLSHNVVSGVKQDTSGHYWISTFGGGLNRWDRETNTVTHFRARPGEANLPVSDYLNGLEISADNKIWFGEGFMVGSFDPARNTFRHYNDGGGIAWSLLQDRENRLWLTKDTGGLLCFNPETGRFLPVEITSPDDSTRILNTRLRNIFQDSQGKIWIQTFETWNSGFYLFDPVNEKIIEIFDQPEAKTFFEDKRGDIWIGTINGLFRYHSETKHLRRYGEQEGLPNNQVLAIQEDDKGRLWLGTNNGLSCFDPKAESFYNYFQSDGLPANAFDPPSHKNERGELFFTGDFGVVYFHPDSIKKNNVPPKLALTGIDLFSEPMQVDKNGPLRQHCSVAKELRFSYWQNDLTLHFAALHFKNPEKNSYQVRLDNYDDDWQELGNLNFARYPKLDPGHYTFRVKAANSDGIGNEEGIALGIVIRPPWFWNIWSQSLYLLLILGGIIALYRFQLNRRLALAEAGRLRELDEVKTRLYTNITHEFRTPLTVIQGTAEQIKDHKSEKAIIQRNSQNLLNLINRMLDLSKLEAGKLQLQMVQGNILPYLSYITESFHSLALNQKINLNFYSDEEQLIMDYDPEKILQIFSNLISNAIKFTQEYGKVTIVARNRETEVGHSLVLQVKDTGTGIAQGQLPFIFDRFHQADASLTRQAEGTGIGLALTKELVELMNGKIRVESQEGEGSIFTLMLPVTNDAVLTSSPRKISAFQVNIPGGIEHPEKTNGSAGDQKGFWGEEEHPRLLIVEDNLDVMQFIASCLSSDYELLFARNGREGIEQALEQIPDIIISDVMMPEVDGFELCHTLKQEERTSHIPIILLTAKADMGSKLEGLEYGADAYLVKPFHRAELEVRLRKLLELRRKLQDRYNQAGFEPEPATQKEDAFVLKVRQLVLEHLDDEAFGPEQLSEAIFLHRSHLHRKLKALTGRSTSIFIRQVRLQEAYRLLQKGDIQVKEAAYAVGFLDPGYFSKLFSEEFGRPPSQV